MPLDLLEVSLGMIADRAGFGGIRSFMDVAAVPASPADRLILCEEGTRFQFLQQYPVTLLVGLFDSRY